jgi:hypothetical protein
MGSENGHKINKNPSLHGPVVAPRSLQNRYKINKNPSLDGPVVAPRSLSSPRGPCRLGKKLSKWVPKMDTKSIKIQNWTVLSSPRGPSKMDTKSINIQGWTVLSSPRGPCRRPAVPVVSPLSRHSVFAPQSLWSTAVGVVAPWCLSSCFRHFAVPGTLWSLYYNIIIAYEYIHITSYPFQFKTFIFIFPIISSDEKRMAETGDVIAARLAKL